MILWDLEPKIGSAFTGLNAEPVPFLRREDDNVFYASWIPSNYPAISTPLRGTLLRADEDSLQNLKDSASRHLSAPEMLR